MNRARLPLSGLLAGLVLAPFTATASFMRRSRVFHPRGIVLRGVATVLPSASPLQREVATRLAGPVLARFSGAWWKTHDWPDVLGCALRFSQVVDPRRGPDLLDAKHADVQDLLLATIRVPFTTLLAPLSTHVDDYLHNLYFGVSPFAVSPLGRVKLRLSPVAVASSGASRNERLADAVQHGPVHFQLELRAARLGTRYQPVLALVLDEVAAIDQEALSFDPFKNGRG